MTSINMPVNNLQVTNDYKPLSVSLLSTFYFNQIGAWLSKPHGFFFSILHAL